MPRQLGPKRHGNVLSSPPHRNHAARIALPVIASGAAVAILPFIAAFLGCAEYELLGVPFPGLRDTRRPLSRRGVAAYTLAMPSAPTAARIVIEHAFINEWHPKYDLTEDDEGEYRRLLAETARDLSTQGTISKDTFLTIWKWKGALRVIQHVRLGEYDDLYAAAFRRAASEPPERKLSALLAPGVKLPGVEAPTGSTILHFMHPHTMPIIEVRTVEVLYAAGLLSTDRRDLAHYEEFRQAIEGIRHRCPGWSLREIDRALFAYHRQFLEKRAVQQAGTACNHHASKNVAGWRHRSAAVLQSARGARNILSTNHDRFASVFKNRTGSSFSTAEIMKLMLAESEIQAGNVLPNDHGEGNKGECSCAGTDRQIFDRVGRGTYRVRSFSS
jgi:hypothetical protein